MGKLTTILLCLTTFNLIGSIQSPDVEQWKQKFDQSFGPRFQIYNERFQKLISHHSNISNACQTSLNAYFENPFQKEWTLKMWDSNGHFPSGILSGTFFEPGNYDQCILIVDGNINGKYCILEIRLPPQMDIETDHNEQWNFTINFLRKWNHFSGIDNGICIPSSCTDQEINHIVPQVFIPTDWNLQVRTKLCQERASQLSHLPLKFGQKVAYAILFVHLLMVMIGTILWKLIDHRKEVAESSNKLIQFFYCFCLTENTRILFQIDQDNSKQNDNKKVTLKFIHGMRVFSIYWILLAHVFLFYPFLNLDDRVSPVQTLSKRLNVINNLFTHFIVNAGLAVETFFLISGALTIYTILSASHQNGSINFIIYVLLRWFRFAPATLGAMCLLILWPRVADGPLFHWKYIDYITEPCYHNWWISFAYIANWFPSTKVCNVMHWYLSADLQMHILLYVVLYFFYKRPMISFAYITIMIMFGFTIPIVIVLMDWAAAPNPSIFLHPTHQFPMDKVEVFIFATYNHLIPYFIGALFGLILIRSDKWGQISKFRRLILWIIIFPLFIALPFGSYSFIESTEPVHAPLQSAITFGIVRIIWSLGIFWISFECLHKQCGLIGSFLEADFFQPLSRLSFSIYLVHILPIWHYMFTIRQPMDVSLYNLMFIGMGNAICSTVLAYLLYCFFERPYANMIKIFIKPDLKRKRSSSADVQVNNNNNKLQKSLKDTNENFYPTTVTTM